MSDFESDDRQAAEMLGLQTKKDVLDLFDVIEDRAIQATKKIENAVKRLKQIRLAVDELKSIESELENEIAIFMLNNASLADGDGVEIVTWKLSRPSVSFDERKFREENAELYANYTYLKRGTRRFLVK